MTQDEIIEMARHIADMFGTRMCDENNDTHGEELYAMGMDDIAETIKLVAAKEREACAKVCEELPPIGVDESKQWERATLKDCAAAIRARGEA
jgi:hypothetical protein